MHPIQKNLLRLAKVRDLSELSIREIGRQIADDSTTSDDRVHPELVKYHLRKLVDAGQLDAARRNIGRKLKQTESGGPELISIPLIGSANCGPATIFADERIRGHIRISSSILESKNYQNLFALQASGDSMNMAQVAGEPIQNEDYVIIDRSKTTPRDGEYVVIVEEDKAIIKKLLLDYENEQIVLISESSFDYGPIFMNPHDKWDSLIGGTVVQVVKKPSPKLSNDGTKA